ncbi:MAG: HEAT repeat domain-containing protein [Acidobacteriota bacterium]
MRDRLHLRYKSVYRGLVFLWTSGGLLHPSPVFAEPHSRQQTETQEPSSPEKDKRPEKSSGQEEVKPLLLQKGALFEGDLPGQSGLKLDDRVREVRELALIGNYNELISLVTGEHHKVIRSIAAMSLSQFEEKPALEALIQASGDPDEWVRRIAVDALSYAATRETAGAAQALGRALEDPDATIARAAKAALDRLLAPAQPVSFSTVEMGTDSGFDEPGQFVVTRSESWQRLWSRHRPSTTAPSIDFSSQQVIGVFLGRGVPEATALEVESIEEKPDFLRVRVVVTSSDPSQASVRRSFLSPYHILMLAKKKLAVHIVRKRVASR